MIFYAAKDENGKVQVKTSQGDASAINKNYEKIIVESGKDGIRSALQAVYDQLPAKPVNEALTGEDIDVDAPNETADLIGASSGMEFARFFYAAIERMGELGDSGLDAVRMFQDMGGVGISFSRGANLTAVVALMELASDPHQMQKLFGKRKREFGQTRGRAAEES